MDENKQMVWKSRIEEFRMSGKTQKQCASELGVRLRTFQYWNTKYNREPAAASQTQWLEVTASAPEAKASAIILEVGGVRIAVTEDFRPEFLKNVIKVLKES